MLLLKIPETGKIPTSPSGSMPDGAPNLQGPTLKGFLFLSYLFLFLLFYFFIMSLNVFYSCDSFFFSEVIKAPCYLQYVCRTFFFFFSIVMILLLQIKKRLCLYGVETLQTLSRAGASSVNEAIL